MERILAAADIGSNTAHMLVARSDGKSVSQLDNVNEWIQLGEIVAREGQIAGPVIDHLAGIMKAFRATALQHGVERIYFFATEAMRSAENHPQVAKRLKKVLGADVDVITSQREAELSLRGIELDTRTRDADILLEVGGGSAQIGQLFGGSLRQSESLRLGTGTIIARAAVRHPCPEGVVEDVRTLIDSAVSSAAFRPAGKRAVASGGVVRGLWRALHPDGDKLLHIEELDYLIWASKRLSVEKIARRFNVKPKRAGTLLPGALVYHGLMKWSNVTELTVSEYGIREGAILEIAANRIAGSPLGKTNG